MFMHAKELQFNARVSEPDPRFASMLLDQFGGPNGELKAAMQYFTQAFAARQTHPEKYDMLMDIATEELSHLEIVGATITMLLDGVNAEMKEAGEAKNWMDLLRGGTEKEEMIHMAMTNPSFLTESRGGPRLTDVNGVPWTSAYVNANGDLTVDLRSDIAAESRAKIVYENLIQFTDDPYVKETLGFLMTREVAHFQMFAAALETIPQNFPPGALQADPRYSHAYYNMSDGADARGPWNEGQGPWPAGEHWEYIQTPHAHVVETSGEINKPVVGTSTTMEQAQKAGKELGKTRKEEALAKIGTGTNQWSSYPQTELPHPGKAQQKAGPNPTGS
ncbi:manganese catalase family protein [Altericroceibacterium xinjiangense]|uniref:manganese catalase family protein n=1 Tax=Altericroceibacterium xinjiangense TaxID=762261 RepID=UPI000F7EDD1D|nr:manganese catalase family protein [Altericroceibacterium xinjiangense]